MKIGDNDIHLAQLIYSIVTIALLAVLLSAKLHRNIKRDFASIELIARFRDTRRKMRRRLESTANEDELGLTDS